MRQAISWEYRRDLQLHHGIFAEKIRGIAYKITADCYGWAIIDLTDTELENSGQAKNLQEAKRAAESWLNKPEPNVYLCMECLAKIFTSVEWKGPQYPSWAHMLPGAIQPVIRGERVGYGYLCLECCNKDREGKSAISPSLEVTGPC